MITNPWFGILLVLTALAAALAGISALGNRLHPEAARKALHVSMGLVTLALPWLFTETWPVILLAFIALAVFIALRTICVLHRYGRALHATRRTSLGEYHFVLGTCALFILTRGNDLMFFIPMLILIFADSAAVMVGTRIGHRRYVIGSACKSLEGSVAFYVIAFFCAYVPLALINTCSAPECAGIALMVAAVSTLCEAIAGRGLDNLLVPLGAYAALTTFHEPDAAGPTGYVLAAALVLLAVCLCNLRILRNDRAN